MRYYFAPMEGVTGYLFRQIHHELFPGMDRYYMPFIAPHQNGSIKNKEKTDCDPANNASLEAVPQILSNDAASFLIAARMLYDLGYRRVDLNLGCPSPTVVTKHKGAGFLEDPDRLGNFFEAVFDDRLFQGDSMKLSVKTRLGLHDPAEAERLFEVYDRFPLDEIIIHARTKDQFYRGEADRKSFRKIVSRTHHSLCYNGNLYTVKHVEDLVQESPVGAVMIGRGLLRNPALVRECQGGEPLKLDELQEFHNRLYTAYRETLSGPAHLLGHMKELWIYWETILTEGSCRSIKKVRKARTVEEYECAAAGVFAGAELMPTSACPRTTDKICL